METVKTEDKEMTITGLDGVETKVMAKVITTDHGVTDEQGNPKVSVNVQVPSTLIGATPGEVK